jgi:DNA invertase Pin-like site-specific DNA recombinase
MLIGYMRVSKADGSQVVDLQRDALLAVGVDIVRLYEDHASGHIDDRPGLDACLKSLRAGDTLVVWKLDLLHPVAHRCSRSTSSRGGGGGDDARAVCALV